MEDPRNIRRFPLQGITDEKGNLLITRYHLNRLLEFLDVAERTEAVLPKLNLSRQDVKSIVFEYLSHLEKLFNMDYLDFRFVELLFQFSFNLSQDGKHQVTKGYAMLGKVQKNDKFGFRTVAKFDFINDETQVTWKKYYKLIKSINRLVKERASKYPKDESF
jgi:hypothetical protein